MPAILPKSLDLSTRAGGIPHSWHGPVDRAVCREGRGLNFLLLMAGLGTSEYTPPPVAGVASRLVCRGEVC